MEISILSQRTDRFFIICDHDRFGIDGQPSRIMEVMYQSAPEMPEREFAHIWKIFDKHPGMADVFGKWTINRSTVAIANEWHPKKIYFDTLQELLNYLEKYFEEARK